MYSIYEKNIDKNNLEKYIKLYNFKYKDTYKEYNIQNIRIISDKNNIYFYKNIIIDDKNYKLEEFIPFSFYKVENEIIYNLYTNNNKLLKLYDNSFDIEYKI
jgi:hypothetical protein